MSFVGVIRPYAKVFYILGLLLFPLERYLNEAENVLEWRRIVLVLPTIISFLFKVGLCGTTFTKINVVNDNLGNTHNFITNIFLTSDLLKSAAVVIQNVSCANTMATILRNYQKIEFLFGSALNRPISYRSFHRTYFRKISIIFGIYAVAFVSYVLYYMSLDYDDVALVLIKIIHFLSIGVFVYAIFFIDLITYNLNHLNRIIAKDTSDNGAAAHSNSQISIVNDVKPKKTIRYRLSKYKVVHFRLWQITEQTNKFFGWILLVMTLQCFTDFVYTVIWQVKEFYAQWHFINSIRKIGACREVWGKNK